MQNRDILITQIVGATCKSAVHQLVKTLHILLKSADNTDEHCAGDTMSIIFRHCTRPLSAKTFSPFFGL